MGDPATGLDRNCDLAVTGGRIAAIGPGLASHARQVIELDGKLLTAGWVDLHVHVFEWVTTFGLPPDDAGIHSGVTTAVDQGGTGAYTIPAFKHYIADCALTDIRCFPPASASGRCGNGRFRRKRTSLQPAATITGISAMPSCRAASILAWPAIRPPSSPTSAGVVQPHSLMLAAIAATWASVWVRAFFAYGISRSIAHRSTLSAGHGL
jgi:hypothetical protein